MADTDGFNHLSSAYDQLCSSYRAIDDFRAKLLGFLPLVTGGGLILLTGVPRLVVEAGSPICWWKIAGDTGDVLGLDRFGSSAPGEIAMEKLGFNVDNVVRRATAIVARAGKASAVAGK